MPKNKAMTKDQLDKLKVKLALEGAGSKIKLCKRIGIKPPQLSLLLKYGYIAPKYEKKILKYLSDGTTD